jgi:hypothetical protein
MFIQIAAAEMIRSFYPNKDSWPRWLHRLSVQPSVMVDAT